MKQNSSVSHTLLTYLRHELCTPINSIIGHSELLLEKLKAQPASTLSDDLQKVKDCGRQLLTQVTVVLDRNRRLLSQPDGDLSDFGTTLRMELIAPLSAAIGYCEMLLEEAPAELIPDMEKLNGSARQLLSVITNIVHLARQQVRAVSIAPEDSIELEDLTEPEIEPESIIRSEDLAAPEDFSFIALDDTVTPVPELNQPARGLHLATQDALARERPLEQPWRSPSERESTLVQFSRSESQTNQTNEIAARVSSPKHFQQLQERDKGSLDIENLHRSSLYPPLSRQSYLESSGTTSGDRAAHTSKIVAIHSFRGGTGKSSIASSLAVSLAKQGKRVGVVDIDLLSPGMHVLFGLKDRALGRTLNDYLRSDCLLHEAALDMSRCLPHNSIQSIDADGGAVYLVPASPKPGDIMRASKERYERESLADGFRELIDDLNLDFLLIDMRSGISEETLQAIAVCSLLLVVLRPDYQDYQGTSAILEIARTLSVEEMHLVVNKVLPAFDINAYCQQLETTYDVPVSKILPFYEDIVHLASSEVFSLRYPHHPLTEAIDAMARNLANSLELSSPDKSETAVAAAMTLP